jgi:hypothetical protein
MEMPAMAVWNGLMTIVLGLIGVAVRSYDSKIQSATDELQRVSILLNRTREEVARDSATKAEVSRLTDHIDQRFNKLEAKIDELIRK